MRRLTQAILLLIGSLAFAPGLGAQLYNFPPEVERVGSTLSFAPTKIAVHGNHLSLVTKVLVDGVAAAIKRKTGTRVVFIPPISDPGFAEVEVINPFGKAKITMELLPTLAVERTGNVLDVTINNGDAGCYVVYYSFDPVTAPQTTAGVFYRLFLDLTSTTSGTFATGAVPTSDPLPLKKQVVPIEKGLIGLSFNMQGLTVQAGPPMTSSYTNVVLVPPLPRGKK